MAVPPSLLVSSGLLLVTASYGSKPLAFVLTLLVSFVFLERALSPNLIDGFFREVDAVVIGDLRTVRDAIRDDPLAAPIYAAAVDRVRRAHAFVTNAIQALLTKAKESLSEAKEAAVAAFLWLRLAAGVANLVATALMNTALEEARSRAPSVLSWRGVKGLIRTSPPNEEALSKPGTTFLVVWIAAIFAYFAQALTIGGICSGIASFAACFPCFAALCGFALMEAERVYLWGSYAIDTTGGSDTAKPRRTAGDAAVGVVNGEESQCAREYLSTLFILTLGIDALLIAYMRPFVLASLSIFNVAAAKQAYMAWEDGAHGDLYKWRRLAMKVLAIDIAKVVGTYLVIDFSLGALLFLCLCAKAAFFLDRAIYLSDEGASEHNDDSQEGAALAKDVETDAEGTDDGNQNGAVVAGDVAGDGKISDGDDQEGAGLAGDAAGEAQGTDDVPAENSSGIVASDDEEEEGSTTEEHSDLSDSQEERSTTEVQYPDLPVSEEEGSTTEEHSDVSDSEEQRREESDGSSSSSMDGWSFVGVEPIMPTDVNAGVNRKFRFFL
ncbi:uncharacterized protein [Lolium perenne]|uniref:uncharacterized protein n=1 Tax=Lolium perenne TaxID=4522 RepID=UPI0021EA0F27|nr:uncharacterized protein LOC127330581 [Lolium perenne]